MVAKTKISNHVWIHASRRRIGLVLCSTGGKASNGVRGMRPATPDPRANPSKPSVRRRHPRAGVPGRPLPRRLLVPLWRYNARPGGQSVPGWRLLPGGHHRPRGLPRGHVQPQPRGSQQQQLRAVQCRLVLQRDGAGSPLRPMCRRVFLPGGHCVPDAALPRWVLLPERQRRPELVVCRPLRLIELLCERNWEGSAVWMTRILATTPCPFLLVVRLSNLRSGLCILMIVHWGCCFGCQEWVSTRFLQANLSLSIFEVC